MQRQHLKPSMLTLVALCSFSLACGGNIGYDDPGARIPTTTTGSGNNTPVSGAPALSVFQEGNRVVFKTSTGNLVTWAELSQGDKLLVGVGSAAYEYTHVLPVPATVPATIQNSNVVLGGEIGAGAKVGLPHVELSGTVSPHILVLKGPAAGDKTQVEYVFASCATSLCDAGPTDSTTQTVATAVAKDLGGGLQVRWQPAVSGKDGNYMFSVSNLSSMPPTNNGGSNGGSGGYDYENGKTTQDDGASGNDNSGTGTDTNSDSTNSDSTNSDNTNSDTSPKASGDGGSDNDWIWWVVGGAAVVGGAWWAADHFNVFGHDAGDCGEGMMWDESNEQCVEIQDGADMSGSLIDPELVDRGCYMTDKKTVVCPECGYWDRLWGGCEDSGDKQTAETNDDDPPPADNDDDPPPADNDVADCLWAGTCTEA